MPECLLIRWRVNSVSRRSSRPWTIGRATVGRASGASDPSWTVGSSQSSMRCHRICVVGSTTSPMTAPIIETLAKPESADPDRTAASFPAPAEPWCGDANAVAGCFDGFAKDRPWFVAAVDEPAMR